MVKKIGIVLLIVLVLFGSCQNPVSESDTALSPFVGTWTDTDGDMTLTVRIKAKSFSFTAADSHGTVHNAGSLDSTISSTETTAEVIMKVTKAEAEGAYGTSFTEGQYWHMGLSVNGGVLTVQTASPSRATKEEAEAADFTSTGFYAKD